MIDTVFAPDNVFQLEWFPRGSDCYG